jgi:hypothetical protein
MTTTDSHVTRQTRGAYSTLHVQPRPIVVTIGPGDVISFRELRGRYSIAVPIADAFRSAIRRKVKL